MQARTGEDEADAMGDVVDDDEGVNGEEADVGGCCGDRGGRLPASWVGEASA